LPKARGTATGVSVIEESPVSQEIKMPKESEEPESRLRSKGAAVQLSLF